MKIKYIAASLALCAASAAMGQGAPRSAYFMDGYSYRHELNAAFLGDHNYVSIPGLANINIGLYSSVGVENFLFKNSVYNPSSPYKLTTFMSPNVPADVFLNGLSDNNHINLNTDLTLLSAGFKAFGGFNTITIGAHADAGLNLPKDLFRFMKLGQQGPDTRYSFENLDIQANSYAEIALGHGRKINDKLTVGAKVKFLLGIENVTAHLDRMDVRLSDEQWLIDAQANVKIAAGTGLYVPTKQEAGSEIKRPGEESLIEWNDVKYDNFGLSGFGLGIDLGATYQLLPDLQVSAAVNDLGFIGWKHAVTGRTADTSWTFEGFQNIAVSKDEPNYEENKLGQQLDNMWDDLQDAILIHREAVDQSYNRALHATLHLGAEYTTPFYRGLTGGFLFSNYFGGCQSWTEGRFYANLKPAKWFDCTVNYAASTYGSSFGWMINFHPRGFNFFLGSDHQFFSITPQGVPVGKATAAFTLGMNITFN